MAHFIVQGGVGCLCVVALHELILARDIVGSLMFNMWRIAYRYCECMIPPDFGGLDNKVHEGLPKIKTI